jgi:hypothetical protein
MSNSPVIVATGSTIDLLIFSKPIFVSTLACLIDNRLLPEHSSSHDNRDDARPETQAPPDLRCFKQRRRDAACGVARGARRRVQLLAGSANT